MADLAELLERVKAASGPDQFLGFSILAATNPHKSGPYASWDVAAQAFGWDYRVTASLDAAVALVDRVLPGWMVSLLLSREHGRHFASVRNASIIDPDKIEGTGESKVPALAPLIALLSALIASSNLEKGLGAVSEPFEQCRGCASPACLVAGRCCFPKLPPSLVPEIGAEP